MTDKDIKQAQLIQDFLFSQTIESKTKRGTHYENLFRFLIVEKENNYFIINYTITPASWKRGELDFENPNPHIRQILNNSEFKDCVFELVQNDTFTWTHDWIKTSKSEHHNFPTLVLIENEDKSVYGVSGAIIHNKNTHVKIATNDYEKEDVKDAIYHFEQMPENTYIPELGFIKEHNISAQSLEEACKNSRQTTAGQQEIIIYKDNEWFHGLWNDPEIKKTYTVKNPITLSSIADFDGTPLSKEKKEERKSNNGTIEDVIQKQTIPGDVDLLIQACHLSIDEKPFPSTEENPSVKLICDWWNEHAPDGMKNAGSFRGYIWNEENLYFDPYDRDEPILEVKHILQTPTYSTFKLPGGEIILLTFTAKKELFTEGNFGINVFYADLSENFEIGMDMEEVMESYYSVLTLHNIFRLI